MNEDDIIVDSGSILETLNNKLDLPTINEQRVPQDQLDFVIAQQQPTAENNYTWYRLYRSGWVEQGGIVTSYVNQTLYNQIRFVFTLPITIQANTGKPQITYKYTGGSSGTVVSADVGTTNGGVTVQAMDNAAPEGSIYWEVKGYAAVSELGIHYDDKDQLEIKYNVTNCITEIPQDIKLELNDGVLTLKAGSKLYVPDGFEVDGTTRKFSTIIIDSDKTYTREINNTSADLVIVYDIDAQGLSAATPQSFYSTGTPPTTGMYYNIDINEIHWYYQGEKRDKHAFPLAIVRVASNIQAIKQVFNGFGYIGSTIFALPGIKALFPNGRNADGTLNNKVYTSPSVKIYDATSRTLDKLILNADTGSVYGWNAPDILVDNFPTPEQNKWYLVYDTKNNWWYRSNNGEAYTKSHIIECGSYNKVFTSNEFMSFETDIPFQSLGYNDTSYIAQQAFPSDKYINLTLGADGSQYTIPANGYVCLTGVGNWVGLSINKSLLQTSTRATDIPQQIAVYLPVKKDDLIQINYQNFSQTQAWHVFRFIYAEGVV